MADLILESDIDEERRWEAFQPIREAGETFSRQSAVDRLIDRQLIIQQAKLQPENTVSLAEAREQLQKLRREIPACKEYHCETDAGWQKFVAAQGFTVAEVEERERTEMQILKYIEVRFRSGIHITPEQIKDYYDHTLVPKEAKLKMTPAARRSDLRPDWSDPDGAAGQQPAGGLVEVAEGTGHGTHDEAG